MTNSFVNSLAFIEKFGSYSGCGHWYIVCEGLPCSTFTARICQPIVDFFDENLLLFIRLWSVCIKGPTEH
uniref:Uncharacterized protein n=1 Tax=Globodera rostochiensis TaxID=31243 RepID=A0A914GRC4_GLORO